MVVNRLSPLDTSVGEDGPEEDVDLRREVLMIPDFLWSLLLIFKQSNNFHLAALFKQGPYDRCGIK